MSNIQNNNNNNNNSVCAKSYIDNDYSVDIESNVPHSLRSFDANNQMPEPLVNGGLFSGPQSNADHMPKPVVATTTYFMQELLKTANPPPPPGAMQHYPGDNRLGNNYTPMPGVNWYKSAYEGNKGPFHIKVVDKNHKA